MKHLDLFSGYGGFTIPASKYGIETINFSEIDKYATAVLEYRFPNIKNLGDITKIKPEDLPDVDIITGGSPCQDLSVAGKGAGLDGGRSGLFFCFINLIKEKQPMYFVWENVKGAFSSQRGWDFARVQIEMEQAGYDVWWQLLNAKDFGVPQNRERIFAIGIRKGSGREILFEQRGSSKNPKTREQVSSTIHAGYYKQGGRDQQYINKVVDTGHDAIISNDKTSPMTGDIRVYGNIYPSGGENGQVLDPSGISKTIKSGETSTKGNGGIGSSNSPKIIIRTGHDGTNIFGTDGIAPTQKALGGGQEAKTGLYAVASRNRGNGKQAEFREDAYNSLTSVKSDSMVAIPNSDGNVHSLDANYWKGSNNPNKSRRSQVIVHNLQTRSPNRPSLLKNKNAGGSGHLQREDGVTYTVDTGCAQGVAVPVLTPDRENKRQNGRRFKEDGDPSFTITGQDRHGVFNGMRIRRLTPIECERLMGLEDGWTARGIIDGKEVDISDTQRYKMCGNGVVVNCVDYIYSLISKLTTK